MHSLDLLKPWFLLMFPLVYSPGPANICFASNGGRFGFRRSLPFMAGINISFAAQSLLAGFGLGRALLSYPAIFAAIRYVGICYIVYLAYGFLKAAGEKSMKEDSACLTLKDGLLLTFMNPKAWVMQVMMFSQFLIHAASLPERVFTLTGWLALLNMTGHMTWICFGSFLLSRSASFLPPRVQNAAYAAMLLGSVGYMV